MFGIQFIWYTQGQNIDKTDNLKVLVEQIYNANGLNRITQNRLRLFIPIGGES